MARVLKEPAATAVSTMSLGPAPEAEKRAVDGREVGVGSMKAEAVAVQARTVAKARIVRMCGDCGGEGGGGVGWGEPGLGVCRCVAWSVSKPRLCDERGSTNTRAPRDQKDVRAVRVWRVCVVGGEAAEAAGPEDGVCVRGLRVRWAAAAGCVAKRGHNPRDACGARGWRVCVWWRGFLAQHPRQTNAPATQIGRNQKPLTGSMNNTTRNNRRGEEVGRNTHLLLPAHAGHAPESEGEKDPTTIQSMCTS